MFIQAADLCTSCAGKASMANRIVHKKYMPLKDVPPLKSGPA